MSSDKSHKSLCLFEMFYLLVFESGSSNILADRFDFFLIYMFRLLIKECWSMMAVTQNQGGKNILSIDKFVLI